MAFADLIPAGDTFLEGDEIGLGLAVQPDIGKYGDAKAQRLGIKIGVIAPDTTGFLQRTDTAQAGRWRDAGVLRQFHIGHAAAILEIAHDLEVDLVEFDSGHIRSFR